MKNLAGDKNADAAILEELYLAGIPAIKVGNTNSEVPYTYVGKLGKWTFERCWYYWAVSVEDDVKGLPLDIALELHNRKHPTKNENLGNIIRCGGHCGCPSPDEYGAQPIYDEEFYSLLSCDLEKLGYKKEYINYGTVSKLCNEGKLTVKRYVDSYHIDEQIGLNEFVKTVKATNNISPTLQNRKKYSLYLDMKIKNLILALREQGPLKRAFRNFFITGNAWGLFSIRSHQREDGKLKVMYNSIETATKAAVSMEKKMDKHFSVYKCIYCDGYHLGKNRDNK